MSRLESLGGKRLACHCPVDLDCHGDILIEAYKDKFLGRQGRPPTEEEIQDKRQLRPDSADLAKNPKLGLHPKVPTEQAGLGAPVLVFKGLQGRLLVDGAGLCSPGQWPPGKMHSMAKFAGRIRAQLALALREH